MAEKSKVLVIGGTGYIGKFIVEASAKSGHPTFALVRESTLSSPAKAGIVEGFKSLGVKLVHVSIHSRAISVRFPHVVLLRGIEASPAVDLVRHSEKRLWRRFLSRSFARSQLTESPYDLVFLYFSR